MNNTVKIIYMDQTLRLMQAMGMQNEIQRILSDAGNTVKLLSGVPYVVIEEKGE